MLDWLREGNRIRSTQYTTDDVETYRYIKGFLLLVLYMYCLIVMAVYDFTILGLIAAIVLPVLICILALFKFPYYITDMPHQPILFFITTIVFYFLKNIIIVISGISELFYTDVERIFYQPMFFGIIFAFGLVFTMIKRTLWMIGGFALSGLAITCCVFGNKESAFTTEGGKYFLVYFVFLAAYIIIFSLSEGYYKARIEAYGEKSGFVMADYVRLMNIILLLLAVTFALVNKTEGGYIDWEHVDRFISIAFSPSLMFPLMIAFSIYYVVTDHMISVNAFRTQDGKRIKADQYYTVVTMMMYLLCCVIYKYYFTWNFLLLLAFIVVLFLRIRNIVTLDVNAIAYPLILADVMIATGRTGTAIVICFSVFILYKYYMATRRGMIVHSHSGEVVYEPKLVDVYAKMINTKSFWFLCIGEITVIVSSLLFHIKTVGITYGSFIGSIGAPDGQLLLIVLMCAGISAVAVIMFFFKSYAYRPKYIYLTLVLVFLFVACFAVVKKDTPNLRIETVQDKMYLTCNINESEMDEVYVYRGSSLPFMASYYSQVIEEKAPKKNNISVKYPESDSELCERVEFMVLDKNGNYTSYVCYYPFVLSSFLDSD